MEMLSAWWTQALMAVVGAAMGYGVKAWRQRKIEEAARRVQSLEDALQAEEYKYRRSVGDEHERLRSDKDAPGIRRS